MKFTILEETEKITDEYIKNFITQNCGKFLRDAGERSAYRGIRNLPNKVIPFYILTPPKNRKPRDTPFVIQEALDELLYKKFGWKPRSEGVFVTSRATDARLYSPDVYRIFPIGDYRFVWSTKIRDFYKILEQNNWTPYSFHGIKGDDELETMYKVLEDYVEDCVDDDLFYALENQHEIMIGCEKYVAISADLAIDLGF